SCVLDTSVKKMGYSLDRRDDTRGSCFIDGLENRIMEMIDGGDRDEKILCVPDKDPRYAGIKTLEDIAPHRLEEIAEFFRTYKNLEKKVTEIGDWKGLDQVNPLIEKCIAAAKG
ncbi:MAG: inorganic diphosphatase, partial [Leptolyngbyaceae bacterium]|nr:inorganic diphosphatase [Leptolyngbyaceae bacterium]